MADLDIEPKTRFDDPRLDLPLGVVTPASVASAWPVVSASRLEVVRQQALETSLLVASVQAAGVYLYDLHEEERERVALENGTTVVKGGDDKSTLEGVGSVSKKKSLDRRQGRQDIRVSRVRI